MKNVLAFAFLFFSIQVLVSDSLFNGPNYTPPSVRASVCKKLVKQLRRDTMARGAMITALSNRPLNEEMLSEFVAISNALDRQNREYADYCTTAEPMIAK